MRLAHSANGEGIATALLWLSSFVVTEIVPVCVTNIGWRTYLIFTCCNVAFVPFVYFFLLETAGMTLVSIDLCFMDRSTTPVKNASQLRNQIKCGGEVTLNRAIDDEKRAPVASHVEQTGSS